MVSPPPAASAPRDFTNQYSSTPSNTLMRNGRTTTEPSGFWRSCLWGRGTIVSIGRINCARNAGSLKLTMASSSTFSVSTSRLKNPLQSSLKMKSLWGQLWLIHKNWSASKPRRYVIRSRMSLLRLIDESRNKLHNYVSRGSRWTTTMSQPPITLSWERRKPKPLVSG